MVATAGPRWPRGVTGPRALVECGEPAVQDGLVRVLEEHGFAVATCAGPAARPVGGCPLVTDGTCGLVDDADIVIHALDPTDADEARVLAAVSRRAASVIAEMPGTGIPAGVSPDACEWVHYPVTRAELLAALERSRTT